jgi:hypothetical protein
VQVVVIRDLDEPQLLDLLVASGGPVLASKVLVLGKRLDTPTLGGLAPGASKRVAFTHLGQTKTLHTSPNKNLFCGMARG